MSDAKRLLGEALRQLVDDLIEALEDFADDLNDVFGDDE